MIVLNKLDLVDGWRSNNKKDIQTLIMSQKKSTRIEFHERVQEIQEDFKDHVC